jgi:hypothetical protein
MVIERKSINGFSFPGLYYDDDVNIVLRSEESFFSIEKFNGNNKKFVQKL